MPSCRCWAQANPDDSELSSQALFQVLRPIDHSVCHTGLPPVLMAEAGPFEQPWLVYAPRLARAVESAPNAVT
jgi:hypothetical protein